MKKFYLSTAIVLLFASFLFLLPAAGNCCWEPAPQGVIEDNCTGGGTKILIVYDTEHGATAIVAQKIFQVLCDRNFGVDLVFVDNLDPDKIADYDGIILGSPIYIGQFLPGMNSLLSKSHAEIAKIPSSFFITCTYIGNDTPERQTYAKENYVKKNLSAYSDIKLDDIGILGGEFTYDELYWWENFLMRLANFKEGNYIDDDKIAAWANGVGDKLK
jgi:menaquinone-dependent protoporphyrinogen oxidase